MGIGTRQHLTDETVTGDIRIRLGACRSRFFEDEEESDEYSRDQYGSSEEEFQKMSAFRMCDRKDRL